MIDFAALRTLRETLPLAERRQQLAAAEARAAALRLRYPAETSALRLGRSIGCDAIRRIAASLDAPPEIVDGYTDPATEWILAHLSATASDRINAEADLRMATEAARPTLRDYSLMEWDEIPEATRYVGEYGDTKGQRFVFGYDNGTCLMTWTGPVSQ